MDKITKKIFEFYRGVVLLDIDLTTMDINQCSTTEEHAGHFSGTHKCRQKSTDVS